MHKHNSVFSWLPSITWGLIIVILSLMPGGPGNMDMFGIPYFDKIGHFGMYAIWTFLIQFNLSKQKSLKGKRTCWLTVLFGAVTGILLEVGQLMMHQGRSFEVADMVANALGAASGAIFYVWLKKHLG